MIYHLTTAIEWQLAEQRGHYSAPSLDSEGFIHCSTREQVLPVANALYRNESDLIILCIDEQKLQSVLKWEPPAHPAGSPPPDVQESDLFPHVYGTISLDAIEKYMKMPQDDTGYQLPEGM